MAQLVVHHPTEGKVADSVPSWGAYKTQAVEVSLTSMFLSFSSSLPSPLSLKKEKKRKKEFGLLDIMRSLEVLLYN